MCFFSDDYSSNNIKYDDNKNDNYGDDGDVNAMITSFFFFITFIILFFLLSFFLHLISPPAFSSNPLSFPRILL